LAQKAGWPGLDGGDVITSLSYHLVSTWVGWTEGYVAAGWLAA
jgi:hypothetical protein